MGRSEHEQQTSNNIVPAESPRTDAEFRVSGQVQRYGPSKFAVTVESYRIGDGFSQQPVDTLAEMCSTVFEAQDALRRLLVTLGAKIRERGGVVLTVESNDENWGV